MKSQNKRLFEVKLEDGTPSNGGNNADKVAWEKL